ncbi:FAD-binding monooxygenase [uncultured Candidatus Puniceispirillum sp.]|uniref:FAD-binding monooxygenase n=1 Tax=uncultured Candidatus Puniceispirillum sp. TaxID=1985115 RepID=UPI0032B2912A
MQFHLNGYHAGDPDIADLDARFETAPPSPSMPPEVDVLIVGCGPAGLTLAAQLAAFPDITTRIIDAKPGRLTLGQADGIACRTMEMFAAFGFAERVMREAYWVNEVAFWEPAAISDSGFSDQPTPITRSRIIQDTEDGLSEFPHVILNQARVHDFFLDVMAKSPAAITPDYARAFRDLTIDNDADNTHPVTVTMTRTDAAHEGEVETLRARYVVGCDGARSQVRRALGRRLEGDSANKAWGVMDVLVATDFPDIRRKAIIHSAEAGNLLIIPREGGYMVRIYIELEALGTEERVKSRNITADHLVAAAQKVFHPYQFDVKQIAWWSVYEIGQRLCAKFDDVSTDDMLTADMTSRTPHVFIAGDACHTHSPKAGQGMNVSMGDSFNLGWKLAAVLRGQAAPHLLHSYSAERQAVASELIDFDRELATMFSTRPEDRANPAPNTPDTQATPNTTDAKPDAEAEAEVEVDPAILQSYFIKHARYTAGTMFRYHPSLITASPDYQHLATGFDMGMRFHSAPVVRVADGRAMHLGHTIKADGRWHLFAFAGAGDAGGDAGDMAALCRFMADDPASPLRAYTRAGADSDAVIDLRAIFQQPHTTLRTAQMHPLLVPVKGTLGLRDYEKIFAVDHKSGDDIYAMRGINRDRGCMVLVRPDQHVAHILPLDAHDALTRFFAGFMLAV